MQPTYLSEDEVDARYHTSSVLESGGDYGCGCLVYEGDVTVDGDWLDHDHFRSLIDAVPRAELTERWGHADIGTVVVAGNLTVHGTLDVTNQLMCLVVSGDLTARALFIRNTEMYVAGDARLGALDGDTDFLTVGGDLTVGG